ncbi:CotH kinase family protein, partial [Saprospiraceae bacterium]|nr:CotH kinase family protein [Saprospiraceae bacterium]
SLTFDGETISPIGIRYKGSIGAFLGCVSGNDWINPSGYKTCTKLSLKIKINWEGREEKFYGLKKIQLHSMNNDDSQMRDRLGYWLFSEMGIPAPRATHAKLMVNGKYVGVFALIENIDGRFTRLNFDSGEGNLYKEVWPLNSNNESQSEQKYIDALKTNKDENPNVQLMKSFAEEIVTADFGTDLQNVISDKMNINEIIAYAVVDRTIRHDDGPFHWYCSGGGCNNHNYFWYENPSTEKFHLIPWDLDNAFENIIFDSNPVTSVKDEWGEITANCEPFNYGPLFVNQRSAACDKLTAGWASFENEFNLLKTEFINGPLSLERTNAKLNEWKTQIHQATFNASENHSDAITISNWENSIEILKQQLEYAREN